MNVVKEWRIGIISTSFDLNNERKLLIDELEKKKFDVVAFEEPNFPMKMNVEKNIACLEAFTYIDIGIVIIGNEKGSCTDGDKGTTQKEYEYIKQIGKKVYIFVQRDVWSNYQNPNLKFEVKSASFLDYINSEGDFVTPFNDIIHLKELVEGRLKGLSFSLLREIAERQYTKLMNTQTIPSIGIKVSEQINQYYMTPSVYPMQDPLDNSINPDELYKRLTRVQIAKKKLIRGDIGSGKSTLLYVNYKNHYQAFINEEEYKIPLYLALGQKGKGYTLDDYFSDCFFQCYNRHLYPMFSVDNNSYVLYLDGLDEMNDICLYEDASLFLQSNLFGSSVLMSCRNDFYENYIRGRRLCEFFDMDICVQKWSKEDIIKYIKLFRNNPEMEKYICEWIEKNFDNWLQTPLMVSIICFLLKEVAENRNMKNILEQVVDERTLMVQYTSFFIKRELKRVDKETCYEGVCVKVMEILGELAWKFYQQKIIDVTVCNKIVSTDSLEFRIAKTYLGVSYFEQYCTYKTHEYFLDFLISCYVLARIKQNDDMDFLNKMLSANINKLILQGINKSGDMEKEEAWNVLFSEYKKALAFDTNNIIKRTHIVYYLGRVELDSIKEKLKEILTKEEKNIEVKLSICFGMIKLGNLEIEDYLYDMLEHDADWDAINRGYHLLYYKDIENKDIPFHDDGKGKWDNTFKALKNHICCEHDYYYLGRIDLQIIKKFYLSHTEKVIFTHEEVARLEQCISQRWNEEDTFCNKVIDEWSNLKNVIRKNIAK